jgi:hypothetical protein
MNDFSRTKEPLAAVPNRSLGPFPATGEASPAEAVGILRDFIRGISEVGTGPENALRTNVAHAPGYRVTVSDRRSSRGEANAA